MTGRTTGVLAPVGAALWIATGAALCVAVPAAPAAAGTATPSPTPAESTHAATPSPATTSQAPAPSTTPPSTGSATSQLAPSGVTDASPGPARSAAGGTATTPSNAPTPTSSTTPIENVVAAVTDPTHPVRVAVAVQVRHVRQDDATVVNVALAAAGCDRCTGVAVALQVVLVDGPRLHNVVASNTARSLTTDCHHCHALAVATQVLVAAARPVTLGATTRTTIARTRQQLQAVAQAATPPPFNDLARDLNRMSSRMQAQVLRDVRRQLTGDTGTTRSPRHAPGPTPAPSDSKPGRRSHPASPASGPDHEAVSRIHPVGRLVSALPTPPGPPAAVVHRAAPARHEPTHATTTPAAPHRLRTLALAPAPPATTLPAASPAAPKPRPTRASPTTSVSPAANVGLVGRDRPTGAGGMLLVACLVAVPAVVGAVMSRRVDAGTKARSNARRYT